MAFHEVLVARILRTYWTGVCVCLFVCVCVCARARGSLPSQADSQSWYRP
jgi:hypothetical protein